MSTTTLRMAHSDRRAATVLVLIAGIASIVGLVYADSFLSLAAMWRYSSHQHGVIVIPLCAYLLWRVRESLAAADLEPSGWGVGAMLALVPIWILGRAVGVQAAEHFAIVLLIPASIVAFLGVALARRAAFPLMLLLALVPVGDALVPHLMRVTAWISTGLLNAVGVPVYRDGQFLTLPGGEFEIADVCAGLHFLISGTIVTLLFAYLNYASFRKRAAFVALGAIVLVLGNGVRAFIVMLVASASHMRYLAGHDHVYFGWLLFGAIIVALLSAGARFADPAPSERAGVARSSHTKAPLPLALVLVLGLVMLAATSRPLQADLGRTQLLLLPAGALLMWVLYKRFGRVDAEEDRGDRSAMRAYRRGRSIAVICAAAAVLASGPAMLRALPWQKARISLVAALPALTACEGPSPWTESWMPELDSPDVSVAGTYSCSGAPVRVFIAGFANAAQGAELVSDSNQLTPPEWRRFTRIGASRFETSDGRAVDVNELIVDGAARRSLIWYWYAAGSRTALTPAAVKLDEMIRLVTDGRLDSSIHLLETPLERAPEASRGRLAAVAGQMAALQDRRNP